MLLESLYVIVDHSSLANDRVHYSITIDPSNDIFKGHFPGFPVTPGVVEIEIVKELVEHHINQKIGISKISNCKFMNLLNPEETSSFKVMIELISLEPAIAVVAEIYDSTRKYLSIKANFELRS